MSKPLYSKSTTNCPVVGGAVTVTTDSEKGIKVPNIAVIKHIIDSELRKQIQSNNSSNIK